MILQALYALAQYEGLVDDPDFQPAPVAWWIILDKNGRLINIKDKRYLPPPEGKKKPRPITPTLSVPFRAGRTVGVSAQFLVDNAQYVFGMVAPDSTAKPARVQECFQDFRTTSSKCAEQTSDIGATAVAKFIESIATNQVTVPWNPEWEPNHLFAFALSHEPDVPVHLRSAVMDYWRKQRQAKPTSGTASFRCLVTGQPVAEPGLFPLIKRVPGGSSSGVGLVSFNASAFLSHGWEGNENAPVSREAAEGCATALNRLLHPAYPSPREVNVTLPERNIRLSSDTAACYWSPSPEGDEVCDMFAEVLNPDPNEVRDLYQSVWKGTPKHLDNPAQFYAMTLSGTQGRAIVRDWFEMTVGQVLQNLGQYFRDIDIVRNTPPPKAVGKHPAGFPLRTLLRSLAVNGDEKRLAPHVAAEFFNAAISGLFFPQQVLHLAVERTRFEASRNEWLDSERRDARAAIIKACLNRARRLREDTAKRYPEVQRTMDPNNTTPAYLLGRMMATLERMQQVALGDVNATIVDRYLSGAAIAPNSIFPRLLLGAHHHYRKAREGDKGKTVEWLKREIDKIAHKFKIGEAVGRQAQHAFPRHLTLEQQGLFVLGYHQQRYWLWMGKDERAAWAKEYGGDTPPEDTDEDKAA